MDIIKNKDVLKAMKYQNWCRAKGELTSMMMMFEHEKQLKDLIVKFVTEIEEKGLDR